MDDDSQPNSNSHLPADVRLEMLVGWLADQAHPTQELVRTLRLQSNASVTTRAKLDQLNQCALMLWQTLREIQDEAKAIRQENSGRR